MPPKPSPALTVTVSLSGIAAVAALVVLFVPVIGVLLLLAGTYSGKSFPTPKNPVIDVPSAPGGIRALLIIVGLLLLALGVWMQGSGVSFRLFRLDQGKVAFDDRNTDSNGTVYAQGKQSGAIESFSLRQRRAVLLQKDPFAGAVALAVGDVHLFGPSDVAVIQNPQKYALLRKAASTDAKVGITKTELEVDGSKVSIDAGDVLLKAALRAKQNREFSFKGGRYTLVVCRVDHALIGPDYITINIRYPGTTTCN